MNCILFQGLSGSIPKGYNTPKGPTSKGLHRIPQIQFTKGSQIVKMATRKTTRFRISPRRRSALLNSYVIAHSTSFNINDEMQRMMLVSIRCLTWLEKYCFATSLGLVIDLKAKLRNMQICLFQWHRDHENLLYCELKLTSTGAVNLR